MEETKDNTDESPDQIIVDLGGCGRYQMRMSIISHLQKTLICWSTMSIIITTKTPDFWCDNDVTSGNVSMGGISDNVTGKYEALKSCVTVNNTKCTRFRYDDSIRTLVGDFDLVCDNRFVPSTMMSIQSAGILVGNLAVGQIADLFGRKIPFFSSIVLVTVAEFVSLALTGWVPLAITRFFIGFGAGAFMPTTYSLLCEFSLAKHRVWIIGFPSWPIEACVFCLVAWLSKDWRYMNLACALVGIPCLFAWWVIPESFRWYLAHGKKSEAEKILETVANYNNKPLVKTERLDKIVEEERNKKDQKYTLLHMFKSRYLVRVTLLLAVNWFGLGFVGYGILFGIQALSGSIYLNLFLFSIVGIPSKAIAIWLQNRIGRRGTAIFCYGMTALACFVVGVVQGIDTDLKDSLTNGFALVAKMGISTLWGPIQTMTIELYPTVIRGIGFGTLSVLARLGSVIGPQMLFLTQSTGGPGLMYYTCGAVASFCFLALFGLPETKDGNLSDKIAIGKTVPGKECELTYLNDTVPHSDIDKPEDNGTKNGNVATPSGVV